MIAHIGRKIIFKFQGELKHGKVTCFFKNEKYPNKSYYILMAPGFIVHTKKPIFYQKSYLINYENTNER